ASTSRLTRVWRAATRARWRATDSRGPVRMRYVRCATGLGLAAALAVVAGCAPAGPTYYHVAGTVSFDGRPVPKGTVSFEPDAAKGVRGQMGYADLVDGKFDTRGGGKGVLGGPYVIRILG